MNGQPHSNISIFMLGAILNTLAVVDVSGLVDYSVKAIVGGCIWLSFKIIADFLSNRMQTKPKEKTDSDFLNTNNF